jgi:MFS family permease
MGLQSCLFDHICLRYAHGKSLVYFGGKKKLPLTRHSFAQAVPKYNYNAICGIHFLSCIGLGSNDPIDATIALEFLPQNRRFLVSLLSMWLPVGVVVASAVAYGATAKYQCHVKLPSGKPCCTVSSNMGWRYEFIVLGCMTLLIFVLRYFMFTFHENPKFLLGKGREQEAIDVLHAIAKFNEAPPPTLTIEHFREIDTERSAEYKAPVELNAKQSFVVTPEVLRQFQAYEGPVP